MHIFIDDNENCGFEERVFKESGPAKEVLQVQVEDPKGQFAWYEVTGVEEGGAFVPAKAILVDDSGAGNAYLVFGGTWGLRFRNPGSADWSLKETAQWGEPFKVLDDSGKDIRFK